MNAVKPNAAAADFFNTVFIVIVVVAVFVSLRMLQYDDWVSA